ncbi:MAG: hypothetical protein AAGA46_03205 [Cyanobacteria bacterium P01_F01_bin.13]
MPAAGQPLSPAQATNTVVEGALIPIGSTARPTSGTGTVSGAVSVTAQGTGESVSATLDAALTGSLIQVGQPLEFEAPDGTSRIAIVRTTYAGSGTTLELTANETIPDNSTFSFPPKARLRQSADINRSTATTTFSSFDHSVASVSIGDTTADGTFNGGYNYYDAFWQTCQYAQTNKQKLYISRQLESPDSSVFGTGPITWGVAVISGLNSPAANGAEVQGNVTVAFDSVNDIDPQT